MECGPKKRGPPGSRDRKGDKLRLLAVPHIFRRQGGLPIVSIPHRSGGPSGSARALRYRPTLTPHRARAPGYRPRGHAIARQQYLRDRLDTRNKTTCFAWNCHGGTRAAPPGWWASCTDCNDGMPIRIISVVFRHHVVMLFHIIGPTLPFWHCHIGSPSPRALFPRPA